MYSDVDQKLLSLYDDYEENYEKLIGECKEITPENLYCINIGEKSSERFQTLINKTDISSFFEAFYYEYGLFKREKNLKKAFEIYEKAAKGKKDYLSMYKMFLIYLKDYQKFNVHRDRILEQFYLIKSVTYLPEVYFSHGNEIYEFITPLYIFAFHLDLEDPKASKFFKFIELLKESKKYKDLTDENELELIRLSIGLKFEFDKNNNEEDEEMEEDEEDRRRKEINKEMLNDLKKLSQKNADALYALMMIYSDRNSDNEFDKELLETLEQLVKIKYYKAYDTCGLNFFNHDLPTYKILKTLKEGWENGNYFCIRNLYDSYMSKINLKSIFENKKDEVTQFMFLELFELIIDANILGERFCAFRLFNNSHFLMSKLDYPKEIIREKYSTYIDELSDFIQKLNNNQNFFKLYNFSDSVMNDFKRTYSYILIKNTCSVIEKDIFLAKVILLDYKSTAESIFDKAISASLLYKVSKQLFKIKAIDEKEYEEVKKDYFTINKESIEQDEISRIDFYFLAKCYKNGIGTEENIFSAYCNYHRMKITKAKLYETVVSRSKYFKAMKILEEEVFDEIKKRIEENKKTVEDCDICFTYRQNIILLPCFHKICDYCLNKMRDDKKYALLRCPFCRKEVVTYETIEIKKEEERGK